MVNGITNIDSSIGSYTNAMGTIQLRRVGRSAIPTSPPLSTSRHRLNSVMDRVNPADRMVFRVDHEDLPRRADTDSLGSIEASGASRSAVAGISFRAIAGNMLEGTFFERQLPDTVSFSQGDPECPLVKAECPGPKDRVAGRQLPVLGK